MTTLLVCSICAQLCCLCLLGIAAPSLRVHKQVTSLLFTFLRESLLIQKPPLADSLCPQRLYISPVVVQSSTVVCLVDDSF